MRVKILALTLSIMLCLGFILTGCQSSAPTKNPIVTIEMESGKTILLELRPDKAPNTVNNFISLIKKQFYDGLEFQYIKNNYIIQGGAPNADNTANAGYFIKGEFPENNYKKNDLQMEKGAVVMARNDKYVDGASCQFFIVLDEKQTSHLNNKYAIFAYVFDEESQAVVDEIAKVDVDHENRPQEPQIMVKVTVDTFGHNYPEPNTIPVNY